MSKNSQVQSLTQLLVSVPRHLFWRPVWSNLWLSSRSYALLWTNISRMETGTWEQ